MKKNIKMLSVLSLGLVALASGAIVGLSHNHAVADEATDVMFEINGVSVREVNEGYTNGVKFRVQLDKTAYDQVKETATFGARLLPKALLGSEALKDSTHEGVKEVVINATDWTETTVSGTEQAVMEAIVYVYDIPERYYGSDIAVLAYAEQDGLREYTEEKVCSLAQVALDAANAGASDLESYYTFQYALHDGVNEEATTGEVIYGNKLTAPANPEKTGYTFKAWTNAVGTHTYDFDSLVKGDVNLYASYDLIAPTEKVEETVKLVDKTADVNYASWLDTGDWGEFYEVEWKLDRIQKDAVQGDADVNWAWGVKDTVLSTSSVTATDWSAMAEGIYRITAKATSKLDPTVTVNAYTATLDLYDETPEFVTGLDADNFRGTGLVGWSGNGGSAASFETRDGREVVNTYTKAVAGGITVNPTHTADYYQWVADNAGDKEYYFYYEFMYDTQDNTKHDLYTYKGKKGDITIDFVPGEWYTEVVKLSDLVSHIEKMRYNYAKATRYNTIDKTSDYTNILLGIYNNSVEYNLFVTKPTIALATTLETVDGGMSLVKKSETSLDIASLFDTSAYTAEFNFAWELDGAAVASVNPSTLADGLHSLQLKATNKLNGLTMVAYKKNIDVYDENETAPKFIGGLEDIKGTNEYSWGGTPTNTITEFEGKSAVKITTSGETRVMVTANALHSKEYYQMWEEKGNYHIYVEYYLPSGQAWTASFNYLGTEANKTNTLSWGNFVEDAWKNKEISLETFISVKEGTTNCYFDDMRTNYEKGSGNVGVTKAGGLFSFYINGAMDLYISSITLGAV